MGQLRASVYCARTADCGGSQTDRRNGRPPAFAFVHSMLAILPGDDNLRAQLPEEPQTEESDRPNPEID